LKSPFVCSKSAQAHTSGTSSLRVGLVDAPRGQRDAAQHGVAVLRASDAAHRQARVGQRFEQEQAQPCPLARNVMSNVSFSGFAPDTRIEPSGLRRQRRAAVDVAETISGVSQRSADSAATEAKYSARCRASSGELASSARCASASQLTSASFSRRSCGRGTTRNGSNERCGSGSCE
jgi:hypothetical protein